MDHYEIITDAGHGLFAERLSSIYTDIKGYLEAEQQHRRLCYTKVFLSDISNRKTS